MMNLIIKIVNDCWSDGLLTFLLAVIYLITKRAVIPELKKKRGYKHIVRALDLAERYAGLIIPEMAKMSSLSNSDRKKEAIKFVSLQLMDHDINLSHHEVGCIVEKIYQYMKGMGHLDVDKPIKTPDPSQLTPQQLDKLTPPDVHPGGDINGQNH